MRKKLPARQQRQKERKKVFKQIIAAMRIKVAIKRFGLKDVLWAMNRFVNNEKNLKRLKREAETLRQELQKIEEQIA